LQAEIVNEIGDGRGRDNAGAERFSTRGRDTRSQSALQRRAGRARVASDQKLWFGVIASEDRCCRVT
jgi:hypothetical protein